MGAAVAVRLKMLAICEGGNVRSVGLAYVLKDHGQDAVAAGWRFSSPETLAMLCAWADRIFVMQGEFADRVPLEHRPKVVVADVGPDRYGTPFHPELIETFGAWVAGWVETGWDFGAGLDRAIQHSAEGPGHLEKIAAGHRTSIVRAFNAIYWEAGRTGGTWMDTRFLNVPVFKYPTDLMVYQELIVETEPDVIVETGTAYGGSALYFATLCQALGHGRVLSVDVRDSAGDKGEHAFPLHPLVTYLTGSSTDPAILSRVREVCRGRKALVILDSDHRKDHVLAEMRAYSGLVPLGGYMVIEDGIINGNPVYPESGPGPTEAIEEFFRECDDFRVDERRERFLLTQNPCGWLKRVSGGSS
jgi:cephalosporin hydroxylase